MNPRHNQLLAALPAADWVRWQPHLEPVTLAYGQVLFESGATPASVVFPTTAVVSLSTMTRDGASAEFAVIGNEGVVGISLFMGGNAMTGRALVQSAGQAWRLGAPLVHAAVERGGAVLNLLLRYTQSLIVQTAQTAACNRHHSIAQQVSRRLLMSPSNMRTATKPIAASIFSAAAKGRRRTAQRFGSGCHRYSSRVR